VPRSSDSCQIQLSWPIVVRIKVTSTALWRGTSTQGVRHSGPEAEDSITTLGNYYRYHTEYLYVCSPATPARSSTFLSRKLGNDVESQTRHNDYVLVGQSTENRVLEYIILRNTQYVVGWWGRMAKSRQSVHSDLVPLHPAPASIHTYGKYPYVLSVVVHPTTAYCDSWNYWHLTILLLPPCFIFSSNSAVHRHPPSFHCRSVLGLTSQHFFVLDSWRSSGRSLIYSSQTATILCKHTPNQQLPQP
jgi:hypothetical protein